MTRAKKRILKKLRTGNFVITVHARERMNERFISELDIVEAAKTMSSIRHQPGNDTYLVSGLSTWGEAVHISVALRNEVVIITVFYEENA